MTREEAIRWIEQISERYIHGGDDDFDAKRREALNMAIKALQTQKFTLPNGPLTINELREMEDEPVYISNVDSGYYAFVREVLDHSVWVFDKTGNCILLPISTFGKDWLAYCHKPKRD